MSITRIKERLTGAARLAAIVGIAVANLALSYCSSSTPQPDVKPPDMASADAGVDASMPDGSKPDGSKLDAGVDTRPPDGQPDTKLWDVLCE